MRGGGGIHKSDLYVMRGSGIHTSSKYEMRGSGIGSIFSNIFRKIVPFAKKLFGLGKKVVSSTTGQQVLKAAKRTAIDAGLNIAHDTLNGVPLKTAAKRGLKKAKTDFSMNVDKELQGGKKRKKIVKRSITQQSQTKRKKKNAKTKKQPNKKMLMAAKLLQLQRGKKSSSSKKRKSTSQSKPKSGKRGGKCKKQCKSALLKMW